MQDFLITIKNNKYIHADKVMNVARLDSVIIDFGKRGGLVDRSVSSYIQLKSKIMFYLRPIRLNGSVRIRRSGILYKSKTARRYGASNVTGLWIVHKYINDNNLNRLVKINALTDFIDKGGIVQIKDKYLLNGLEMHRWYLENK